MCLLFNSIILGNYSVNGVTEFLGECGDERAPLLKPLSATKPQ